MQFAGLALGVGSTPGMVEHVLVVVVLVLEADYSQVHSKCELCHPGQFHRKLARSVRHAAKSVKKSTEM